MSNKKELVKKPIRRHFLTDLMLIVLAIIFVGAVIFSITFRETLYELIAILEVFIESHPTLGIFLFILLSALSVILSPFSSVPLIPIAVAAWGNTTTILLVLVGWMIGAAITYVIGFFTLYPLLERFVPQQKIEYYKKPLTEKKSFWFVLLFRLAMPIEVPGYVLGAVKYNFGKYLLASLLSLIPFAILITYASEAFLAQKILVFFILFAALILMIILLFYFFNKKIAKN